MALPTLSQQALTWQAYGADASNLVCPILCDFTTYSAYTFNPQGLFRQTGNVFATGVVIDNLLSSSPIIVQIGPINETVPPYTKTSLTLGGTSAQVTVSGQQSRVFVTFFRGEYMGTTSGTNYYQAQIAAGLSVETGFINMFAGSTASIPVGYLLCDGTAVSRDTYKGLFSVIGELYGKGDGSTTFNLPDLTSRVPMGAGTGAGLTTRGLGSKGGAEQVTLSASMMPYHTHAVGDPGHAHGVADPGHAHGVNDPGHGHTIPDPGHGHTITDPGHAHGITDPAHSHSFASYNSNGAILTRNQYFTIQNVNNSAFGRNNATDGNHQYLIGHPQNYDGSMSGTLYYNTYLDGSSTGVTVNGAKSGITGTDGRLTGITGTDGRVTGLTVAGAATGIGVQAGTTGITVAYAGGNAAHNTDAFPTVPPYTGVNFVIKT